MQKQFRDLSSGETRRALLIRALSSSHQILLLQDPYEGIDSETRPVVASLVEHRLLNANTAKDSNPRSSIFIASRPEQLTSFCTHVAYITGHSLHTIEVEPQGLEHTLAAIGFDRQAPAAITLPALPEGHPFEQREALSEDLPLVEAKNVRVGYADQPHPVFANINLKVMALQHTQICGPNGSGKSTLLKLITGDHPQTYSNDITVCGFKRGTGESIWSVKRYIGHMSGEMLWNYRGSGQLAGNAMAVVISGLHDSIGLYQSPNQADRHCALAWLDLLGLAAKARQRFQKLSLAEQRLVLIARAMIKRPALLILDEPCQGLDQSERQLVIAVVEKLIEAKACTVLYVTHHDDEAIAGIENRLVLNAPA